MSYSKLFEFSTAPLLKQKLNEIFDFVLQFWGKARIFASSVVSSIAIPSLLGARLSAIIRVRMIPYRADGGLHLG